MTSDLEPDAALHRLGGRADRFRLLRYVTRSKLDAAVAAGLVIRASRGIYVLPSLPPARLVAAQVRGVVTHLSAAELLGLPTLLPSTAVHVTVPPGARPPPLKSVVVHRSALPQEDICGDSTTLTRTTLDCAATLDFAQALAVADSALRHDPDLAPSLRAAAEAARGPYRQRRLRVLAAASQLAANPLESGLRAILLEAGISGFRPQVPIETPGGRMRVDLADVRRRVVLEADSYTWHGDRHSFARDCHRYDELTAAGWRVLGRDLSGPGCQRPATPATPAAAATEPTSTASISAAAHCSTAWSRSGCPPTRAVIGRGTRIVCTASLTSDPG